MSWIRRACPSSRCRWPVASPVGHIASAKLEVVDCSRRLPCLCQKHDASSSAEMRWSEWLRMVRGGSTTSAGFTPTETQTGRRQAESTSRARARRQGGFLVGWLKGQAQALSKPSKFTSLTHGLHPCHQRRTVSKSSRKRRHHVYATGSVQLGPPAYANGTRSD